MAGNEKVSPAAVAWSRTAVELAEIEPAVEGPRLDLLALDEALAQLEAKDKRKADLVKLRYFAGLTNEQAAQALGISPSTADNDWAYARSWLRLAMEGDPSRDPGPRKSENPCGPPG